MKGNPTMTESTLAIVDPRKVVIDDNVRRHVDEKDLAELTESIRTLGLLQLPTVTAGTDGRFHLVIGQRRLLASIAAGLSGISVHVVDAHTAAGAVLFDQIAENEQRSGLTEADLLRGYKELALIGYSVDEIEKRTRKPRERIEAAIAIGDDAASIALVEEKQVDLLHAAAIAEFAGDKKAVKKLTDAATSNPSSFGYKLREVTREKALAESKKAIAAQLKDDGVPVLKDTEVGYNKPAAELTDLATDKGANLTLSNHKKCPGHAAYISAGYYAEEAKIVYVCADWEGNGHKKKSRGSVESDADRQAREKREKAAAELEQAREISRELRTEFVAALLQRNKISSLKGSTGLIAQAVAGGVNQVTGNYRHMIAGYALGFLQSDTTGMTEYEALEALQQLVDDQPQRAEAITLATTLAAHEFLLRNTWNSLWAHRAKRRYLEALTSWGHNLTDLENDVLKSMTTLIEEHETERAAAAAAKETGE